MCTMIRIQKEPICLDHLFEDQTPEIGALLIFAGVVRADGMHHLLLESDTGQAERELKIITDEAESKWGPIKVRIIHRYGELQLGEVIVLIIVAASHRDKAYSASRYIIDELKVRVPIWKADVSDEKVSWIHGEKE